MVLSVRGFDIGPGALLQPKPSSKLNDALMNRGWKNIGYVRPDGSGGICVRAQNFGKDELVAGFRCPNFCERYNENIDAIKLGILKY